MADPGEEYERATVQMVGDLARAVGVRLPWDFTGEEMARYRAGVARSLRSRYRTDDERRLSSMRSAYRHRMIARRRRG